MEVGEKTAGQSCWRNDIQGDTLSEVLKGGLLSTAEAKKDRQTAVFRIVDPSFYGMVHRDVKPDNVILRGEEAVLIDFDASRIYKNAVQRRDTQVLGTTGFAAPEQYGLSQSDGRADIYALGV